MEKKSEDCVKLLGFWASPFVHRVTWALKLKGVEYEYIEEDIYNKSSLLLDLNPIYCRVPVLVHDGKSLPESLIILEYIDEIWNHNPLLPSDPYERAQVRFWSQFCEEKLVIPIRVALCSEGEKQEKAVKLSIEALEKIEQILKGKKFFGGDKIGYLDLIIGFITYILPICELVALVKIFDPLKFPGLSAWKDNFINHEVIKGDEYSASNPELIRYYKWCRKEFASIFASYQL